MVSLLFKIDEVGLTANEATISCPEEIAWRNNWITDEELENLAKPISKSGYGLYLLKLLKEPTAEKNLNRNSLINRSKEK